MDWRKQANGNENPADSFVVRLMGVKETLLVKHEKKSIPSIHPSIHQLEHTSVLYISIVQSMKED